MGYVETSFSRIATGFSCKTFSTNHFLCVVTQSIVPDGTNPSVPGLVFGSAVFGAILIRFTRQNAMANAMGYSFIDAKPATTNIPTRKMSGFDTLE